MDLFKTRHDFEQEIEPEPRRIISPAGLRLSTILESGDKASKANSSTKVGSSLKSKSTKRNSFSRGGAFQLPENDDRSSQDTYTNGYSYNIYSEKAPGSPRLPPRVEAKGFFARRGGWRRLLLIALLFLLVVIAIAIGLAVGLRKQGTSSSASQSADSSSNTGSLGSSSGTSSTGGSTSGGSIDPSANATTNAAFPIGSYSIESFLDTIQSNCTTNSNTWRCYPYTIYNDSPTKSLTTFNWIISADPKKSGSYVISSTSNPFAISFSGAPLTLEGKGTDTERYTFRTAMSKVVIPTVSITDSDNSATTCFFNSTNFQGMLYTKMAKNYDFTSLGITRQQAGASYQDWPFAVRAEQVSSGGSGTPDCYKTVNGQLGDKVDVPVQNDVGSLCSCLYRNWLTPSPY